MDRVRLRVEIEWEQTGLLWTWIWEAVVRLRRHGHVLILVGDMSGRCSCHQDDACDSTFFSLDATIDIELS